MYRPAHTLTSLKTQLIVSDSCVCCCCCNFVINKMEDETDKEKNKLIKKIDKLKKQKDENDKKYEIFPVVINHRGAE